MQDLGFDQLTIIGPGLLGGSTALALRAAGFGGAIVGVSRKQATLDEAVARGCIDRGTTDLAEGAAGANLILVAVPVNTIPQVLAELGALDLDGAIITDVGSTKASVLEAAQKHLPDPSRFVGGHPMAGKTAQGPGAATADLFRGKPCILTPTDATDAAALTAVENLWRAVGANLLAMGAEDHDRQTATVSHLPHLAAVALVLTAAEQGGWDVASTGFRDTTRLASSNPAMRLDIVRANRRHLADAIEACQKQLESLKTALEADDADALSAMLEKAKAVRDGWSGV